MSKKRVLDNVTDVRVNQSKFGNLFKPIENLSIGKAKHVLNNAYYSGQITYPEYQNYLNHYNLGIGVPPVPEEERIKHHKQEGGAGGEVNARANLIRLSEKNRQESIIRKLLQDPLQQKQQGGGYKMPTIYPAVTNSTSNNIRMYGSSNRIPIHLNKNRLGEIDDYLTE